MLQTYSSSRSLLLLEFILLCIALPTIVIVFKLANILFAFLWVAALYCFFVYRRAHPNALKDIWKWKAVNWANMKPMLIRFVLCSIGIFVFTWFYDPDRLFAIVLDRPHIIPFLLVFYTLLSALPQEFIFCSFFFERYAPFFKSDRAKIIASAIVFAYAHMLFINWIAPLFSLGAGIIFALTYSKTKSLALVTIEHGLYGNMVFIIGLGWYFFHGSVS